MGLYPLIYGVSGLKTQEQPVACVRLFVSMGFDGCTRSGFELAIMVRRCFGNLLDGAPAFFGENDRLGLVLGTSGRACLVDPFACFPRRALPRLPFLVVLGRVPVQQRQVRLVQFARAVLHVKILLARDSKGLVLLVPGGVLSG